MAPLQNALAQVGIAKQTAKSTPNTTPTFAHGVLGGPITTFEPSQAVDPASASTRNKTNAYRDAMIPGASFSVRAHKASLGLYLLGAWGSVNTTGPSGSDYTHVFSVGDTLPYLTVTSKRGGSEVQRVSDVWLSDLELSWEANSPLSVAIAGVGCDSLATATFGTPTTDETNLESFLVPVGGTFTVDAVGAVPAAATILAGSIKIGNGTEGIVASGALEPATHDLKETSFEAKLTIVVDNFNDWREILTASTSGTDPTNVQYGSFSIAFKQNLTPSGATTLTLAATRVAFLAELPDVDPGGGAARIELSGIPLYDGTNAPVKPTLVNQTVSY